MSRAATSMKYENKAGFPNPGYRFVYVLDDLDRLRMQEPLVWFTK